MNDQPFDHTRRAVDLSRLVLSPLNVRTTINDEGIEELASSIQMQGLLQNLVVYQMPHGEATILPGYESKFLVVAGGRRLRALQLLKSRGIEFDIPVHVVDIAEAEEISLAENYHREAMHPADEFEAFAHLVNKGRTPLEVAQRFGVDEKHVTRMLRLANVAPEILAEFKRPDSEVSLDQVMALAVTTDQAKQVKVLKAARTEWQLEPDALRKSLTAGKVDLDSDLGKFVGVEDYEAAGGKAEPDLFSDEVYLPDAQLVDKVALDKLEAIAETVRKQGWSWVETRLEFGWNDKQKFREAEQPREKGKTKPWPAEIKGYAGAIVHIAQGGKSKIVYGLYLPGADKKAAAKAAKDAPEEKGGQTAKKAASATFTFATLQRLQGFRTAVLRNELAANPRVMLAAMAADMAKRDLLKQYGESQLVNIGRIRLPNDKNVAMGIESAEDAEVGFGIKEQAWDLTLAKVKGDLFAWLLDEPEVTTHQLLAHLGANALMAAQTGDLKNDAGFAFQHTAGIDMAPHWEPTENWLATLPKATVMKILGAFYGKKELQPLEKVKKDALNKRAAELLKGKGYLPAPLRPKNCKAPWAKKAP